jgi:hypothetical protein
MYTFKLLQPSPSSILAVHLFDFNQNTVKQCFNSTSFTFEYDAIKNYNTIYIEWYERIQDGDVKVDVLQGCSCETTIRRLKHKSILYLRDPSQTIQGEIQVSIDHHSPTQTVLDTYQHLHDQGIEWSFPRKYFAWVKTSIGCVPMASYVLGCADIQYENKQAERLFLNLYMITAWRMNNISFLTAATDEQKGNLIAHMLTMMQHCLTYRNDETRSGVPIDHWTRIHAAPDPATYAFDCEDGSIAIIELCYVLMNAVFSNPSLIAIQSYLQHYTPMLMIGQVPSNKEQFHVYVILHSKYKPCILLESTAAFEACWRKFGNVTIDDSINNSPYIHCMQPLEKIFDEDKPIYGDVSVCISLSCLVGQTPSVKHHIVHSNTKIGVPLKDILNHSKSVRFTEVPLKLLKQKMIPKSILPTFTGTIFNAHQFGLKPIRFTMSKHNADNKTIQNKLLLPMKQQGQYIEQINIKLTDSITMSLFF